MVFDPLPAVETADLCLVDHLLEIAVVGISQHAGKIAARPILVARLIHALDALEGR
jgi:hypothetical protein